MNFTLEVTEITPGELVPLIGGPLTSSYDTRVQIGGQEARVDALDRTDCSPCDACREEAECSGCFPCPDCEATCDTCIETLSFEVPSLPAGPASVVVLNAYGSCEPIPVTILGADTGLTDSAVLHLADSGDSGQTQCAGFGDLSAHDRELFDESSCKNPQNLVEDSQPETLTMRNLILRALDRMLSVMY